MNDATASIEEVHVTRLGIRTAECLVEMGNDTTYSRWVVNQFAKGLLECVQFLGSQWLPPDVEPSDELQEALLKFHEEAKSLAKAIVLNDSPDDTPALHARYALALRHAPAVLAALKEVNALCEQELADDSPLWLDARQWSDREYWPTDSPWLRRRELPRLPEAFLSARIDWDCKDGESRDWSRLQEEARAQRPRPDGSVA